MQVFRDGAFHGQWAIADNHGRPAPAMSPMRLARFINNHRCEGPARDTRGLARAIASKTWSARVVNYHRPEQAAVTIDAIKVPGGYMLKMSI